MLLKKVIISDKSLVLHNTNNLILVRAISFRKDDKKYGRIVLKNKSFSGYSERLDNLHHGFFCN